MRSAPLMRFEHNTRRCRCHTLPCTQNVGCDIGGRKLIVSLLQVALRAGVAISEVAPVAPGRDAAPAGTEGGDIQSDEEGEEGRPSDVRSTRRSLHNNITALRSGQNLRSMEVCCLYFCSGRDGTLAHARANLASPSLADTRAVVVCFRQPPELLLGGATLEAIELAGAFADVSSVKDALQQAALPSGEALRRGKVRIDMLVNLFRRERIMTSKDFVRRYVQLDSSPRGGWEFLFGRVDELVFPSSGSAARDECDLAGSLNSRSLPASVLGQGCSGLTTKARSLRTRCC